MAIVSARTTGPPMNINRFHGWLTESNSM